MISVVIISKDEPSLDNTLTEVICQTKNLEDSSEIVVVDASDGRLDHIRLRHEAGVRWVQFTQPPGVSISIPHQRNVGVRAAQGGIIAFTDAGCRPDEGWLTRLVDPLLHDEHVAAGLTLATPGSSSLYDSGARRALRSSYLAECSTINLAFRRQVFDTVGGFDERFAYGSDIDFTWRLLDAGYRIRSVPDAVVRHDWGRFQRQLRHVLRDDPMLVAYPLFLLGLPLTWLFPFYPALLLVPAWRNRSDGPVRVLVDHLVYGAGVLAELVAR
jgi:GT2 family glycosyltransferase